MRKSGPIIAIFLIVLVPVFLFLLFRSGKNIYKPLPFYGKREGLTASGDTIFQKVPDFSLTDQNGKPYGTEQLKGHIYVVNFFFTSCPNICPEMTKHLKEVQDKFQGRDVLRIVSFSLDPKRDSVQRLASYAQKYGIDNNKWHLVTGPKETVVGLMNGFLVPIPTTDSTQSIYHSGWMILVDKEGHIRGTFNGTVEKEIERLEEDAHTLAFSYENSK